jgi:hypothetical protein
MLCVDIYNLTHIHILTLLCAVCIYAQLVLHNTSAAEAKQRFHQVSGQLQRESDVASLFYCKGIMLYTANPRQSGVTAEGGIQTSEAKGGPKRQKNLEHKI